MCVKHTGTDGYEHTQRALVLRASQTDMTVATTVVSHAQLCLNVHLQVFYKNTHTTLWALFRAESTRDWT